MHVPGSGRTSFRTQAAMDAEVFIFDHDAPCLWQVFRNIKILLEVFGRGRQSRSEVSFVSVGGDRQAIYGTYVNTSVAVDTKICREYSLDIAIEAALYFRNRLLDSESELNLNIQLLETLLEIDVRH